MYNQFRITTKQYRKGVNTMRGKLIQIHPRIKVELYERLLISSAANFRSIPSEINYILEYYYCHLDQTNPDSESESESESNENVSRRKLRDTKGTKRKYRESIIKKLRKE